MRVKWKDRNIIFWCDIDTLIVTLELTITYIRCESDEILWMA